MAMVTVHHSAQDATGVALTGEVTFEPARDWADGLKTTASASVSSPVNGTTQLMASPVPYIVRWRVDGEPEQIFMVVLDGLKSDVALVDLARGCVTRYPVRCGCGCWSGSNPVAFTTADGDIRWQQKAGAHVAGQAYLAASVVSIPDPANPGQILFYYAPTSIPATVSPPSPPWQQISGPSVVPGPAGPKGDPGAKGDSGPPGPAGPTKVSSDPGNGARLGSDGFVFAPAAAGGGGANLGSALPLAPASPAFAGLSTAASREDHQHPPELPAGGVDGDVLGVTGGAPAWVTQPVVQHDTAMPLLAPWTQTKAQFAAAVAGIADGSHAYRDGLIVKGPNGIDAVTPDGRWTWNLTTHDGTLGAPDRVEVWHSAAGAVPTKVAVLSATGTPLAVTAPQTGNTMRQLAGLGAWAVRVSDGTYGSIAITDQATQPGGLWSVAIGNEAKCVGNTSLALGKGAVAGGSSAISILGGTVPQESIGIGTSSIVGNYCVGIGNGTATTGDQATAVGNKAKSGPSGNAFGTGTDAAAVGSVALGYSNSTYGAARTTASNTVQMLGNAMPSGMGKVFIGPDRLVTLTELKAVVASATDFTDFKAKIAALT